MLEPRTYRRTRGRRRPTLRRRGEQPPDRRSAAAASTPTPSCHASARSTSSRTRRSDRSTAPTSSTGRSTTTSSSRTTPRPSVSSASPATPARTRSPRGGPVRTRCRPGPTCSARVLTSEAASGLGFHPYRAPTGVNCVEYDGRPACNNCGFCGFYGCPIDAKGDPVAPLRRALRTGRCEVRPRRARAEILLDAGGARLAACATSTREGGAHEVAAAARGARGRRVRDPAAVAAQRPRQPRRRRSVSSCSTSRPTCSASSRSACTRHRGRAVTHLMDDPMIPDETAGAAARAAGLPYFRGGIVEHGGAGQPIMEACTSPRVRCTRS